MQITAFLGNFLLRFRRIAFEVTAIKAPRLIRLGVTSYTHAIGVGMRTSHPPSRCAAVYACSDCERANVSVVSAADPTAYPCVDFLLLDTQQVREV